MTENKRLCIAVTPEIEKKIFDMRKREEFCRMSISEIVRMLIVRGIEADQRGA